MFRSKLGAFIFVAGVLFAVYRMVGTEENGGELATAGDRISEQRARYEEQMGNGEIPRGWHEEEMEDGGWGNGTTPS